ncbi:MAG: alpha/beta hydrolase [Burkholderiaceae bacterium]
MFSGFEKLRMPANGVEINGVIGGSGPPLLLLHGAPQSHVIWHKIANQLSEHFTVIATDLRGYGDSSKPVGLPDHSNYSKRTMAQDQVEVMKQLGFERFSLVGHDRGARVAHRLAVDHSAHVEKLVTLDIAPTLAMYEQTSMEFARAYFHWFFLIQAAPFPETLIGADPEYYLKATMGRRSAGLAPFTPEAMAEYVRCNSDPATIHGLCEDYRAAATIDMDHDRADRKAQRKIECQVLALWAGYGAIDRCFKPLDEWGRVAHHVAGHALACDHYIPEEAPELLLPELQSFLGAR